MIDPVDPSASDDGAGREDTGPATVRFLAARHFTRVVAAHPRTPYLIVLHTTENDCAAGVAGNVAAWFAGPSAPQASAHYVVGPDVVIQCVDDADIAWTAPGANDHGIQIEMVGRAAFTAGNWAMPAAVAMQANAAALVARLCLRHAIPPVFVTAAGLMRGERGVTTHAEVSAAFHGSTHWDPGPNFPIKTFLDQVRDAAAG